MLFVPADDIRSKAQVVNFRLSFASKVVSFRVPKPDLGISDSMLYHWRQRYTSQGDKTRGATLEEEVKALRLENAELKMERDMLKKAAAYFAKQQK